MLTPKIVTIATNPNGAGFYRQEQILATLYKDGWDIVRLPPPYAWVEEEIREISKYHLDNADILFCWSPSSSLNNFLREWKNIKEFDNKNIKFVFDYDDDVFNVDPINQAYGYLGIDEVKDGKGNYLWKSGETIYIPTTDGDYIESTFDIKRNSENLVRTRDNIVLADIITTPSKILAKSMTNYRGKKDPFTVNYIPNAIDDKIFKKTEKKDNKVNILWTLSSSHFNDYARMRPYIGKVLRNNPNAFLYLVGSKFGLGRDIPLKQVKWINFKPTIKEYTKTISDLAPDIGIAWVNDTEFNRNKSILKWSEYTAIGASVCASTVLYGDYLTEKECMLASNEEEFATNLDKMIKSEELRTELYTNADNIYRKEYILNEVKNRYKNLFMNIYKEALHK